MAANRGIDFAGMGDKDVSMKKVDTAAPAMQKNSPNAIVFAGMGQKDVKHSPSSLNTPGKTTTQKKVIESPVNGVNKG